MPLQPYLMFTPSPVIFITPLIAAFERRPDTHTPLLVISFHFTHWWPLIILIDVIFIFMPLYYFHITHIILIHYFHYILAILIFLFRFFTYFHITLMLHWYFHTHTQIWYYVITLTLTQLFAITFSHISLHIHTLIYCHWPYWLLILVDIAISIIIALFIIFRLLSMMSQAAFSSMSLLYWLSSSPLRQMPLLPLYCHTFAAATLADIRH